MLLPSLSNILRKSLNFSALVCLAAAPLRVLSSMSHRATTFSPALAISARLPPPMPPTPTKAMLSFSLAARAADQDGPTPPAAQKPAPARADAWRKRRRFIRPLMPCLLVSPEVRKRISDRASLAGQSTAALRRPQLLLPLLRCADAVKVLRGPNNQLTLRHRRGRIALAVQRVLRHELERRPRLDHVDLALVGGEVEVALNRDRRGAVALAQLLYPEPLAGPRLEAAGEPLIGDDEEIPAMSNRRGDVGRLARADLAMVPGDVTGGDVAVAVGPDPHQVILGKPGRQEEQPLGVDEAGDVLFGRPVDDPEQLARVGVVARDALAARLHQLRPPARVHDDGSAVRACLVGPVGPPALLAGGLVQGDKVALGVLVAIEDHGVLVEDRRAAKAVTRQQLAGRGAPHFLAVEIVTHDDHVGLLQEGDPDVFAVSGGRGAGVAVEAVLLFERSAEDCLLPEELAVAAVDAGEDAGQLVLDAPGQEDSITPDDGRGVAVTGQPGLPADVLGVAELRRDAGLFQGAVAAWAAPAGPVFPVSYIGRPRGREEEKESKESKKDAFSTVHRTEAPQRVGVSAGRTVHDTSDPGHGHASPC